jgi:predicted nicotinamide N-methyase
VPEIRLHLADEAVELWHMTEAELDASGLPLPFWAFAWAGGQALARYVLDHPELVAGKRVLSFAAGSGLEAIACVKAGAASVVASDIDSFALEAMDLNAAANGVAFERTDHDFLADDVPDVDVILLGDIFYERPLAEGVTRFAGKAVAKGITVIAGDPGRSYLPRDLLEPLAEYRVPTTRALEDAEVKRTVVWAFRSQR